MSHKWRQTKAWDDAHLTGVLLPVKWVLRAFSSITQAVILMIMLALYGVGAFASLAILGPPRSAAAIEKRLVAAQLVHACGLVTIGTTSATWVTGLALMICGGAWLAVSNSLMTAAQLQLPAQARGRGLSAVYAVGMAGLALGGPLWGSIASRFGIGTSFICAGVTSVAFLLLTYRRHVTTALRFGSEA